jgi:hypothetical protein
MSELVPFLKWGSLKSQDQNKPDVLELQISDVETFETAYSVNVKVLQKDGETWKEIILPLKAHESKNPALLKEWEKNTRKGNIKPDKFFKLHTWLDTSKNGRPIRRFKLIF